MCIDGARTLMKLHVEIVLCAHVSQGCKLRRELKGNILHGEVH